MSKFIILFPSLRFSSSFSSSISSKSSLSSVKSGLFNLKLLISMKKSSGLNFSLTLNKFDLIKFCSLFSSSSYIVNISLIFFILLDFFNLFISLFFSMIYSFWE